MKIKIMTIDNATTWHDEVASKWNPNSCGMDDYDTPRAQALYDALGVSKGDDEYVLCAHTDGRWALIGLTTSGSTYAMEA